MRLGVVKDDNIAPLHGLIGQQPAAEWARWGVDLFVDQEKIAHQQGALHAFRRNRDKAAEQK